MSYKALKPILDTHLKDVARLSLHQTLANYDGVHEKITIDIITEKVDSIAQKYSDLLLEIFIHYIDLEVAKARQTND